MEKILQWARKHAHYVSLPGEVGSMLVIELHSSAGTPDSWLKFRDEEWHWDSRSYLVVESEIFAPGSQLEVLYWTPASGAYEQPMLVRWVKVPEPEEKVIKVLQHLDEVRVY